MNARAIGLGAAILVIIAAITSALLLLGKTSINGVAILQLPASNRFAFKFASNRIGSNTSVIWNGEVYFDGALSLDAVQYNITVINLLNGDTVQALFNKGRYILLGQSQLLGASSQCMESSASPDLSAATSSLGGITAMNQIDLMNSFPAHIASYVSSNCAGSLFRVDYQESIVALCMFNGLPTFMAVGEEITDITAFKAEGSFSNMDLNFPGSNCPSILSDSESSSKQTNQKSERTSSSTLKEKDNLQATYRKCVLFHGLTVDNPSMNILSVALKWQEDDIDYAKQICSRVIVPSINMMRDVSDRGLQDEILSYTTGADFIVADGTASLVLSRACIDRNLCVQFAATFFPSQGTPFCDRMKDYCPKSKGGSQISNVFSTSVISGLGFCHAGCYSAQTCGRNGSKAICSAAEKTKIKPYIQKIVCGESYEPNLSELSSISAIFHHFFTSTTPGPLYKGSVSKTDGMVPLDSCTHLATTFTSEDDTLLKIVDQAELAGRDHDDKHFSWSIFTKITNFFASLQPERRLAGAGKRLRSVRN